MSITIESDEALVWARAYAAQNIHLARAAIAVTRDMSEIMQTVGQFGGWEKWKEKHPDTYAVTQPRWQQLCKRYEELRHEVDRRCEAAVVPGLSHY